jgi:hypothetical protein
MTKMRPPAHPVPSKILHWIGATSIIWMLSGGAIYNTSRSYGSAPISSRHF